MSTVGTSSHYRSARSGRLGAVADAPGFAVASAAACAPRLTQNHAEAGQQSAEQQEHHRWHAGDQPEGAENAGHGEQRARRCRTAGPAPAAPMSLRRRDAGDDEGRGGRQQQRRNLGDQAVADGQQHVVGRGLRQRHAVLQHADDETADDVDEQDQDAGDRVAADELAGAVHRAVEVGFLRDLLAARARLLAGRSGRRSGRRRWPSACRAWRPE